MPISPRDVEAYYTALLDQMQALAPELDVRKGPLSVLLYAMATEGSRTENYAAYLQSLYQLSDPALIRDEDIYELGLNFGKDPNLATPSQVVVYFYRNTRPEAGTIYRVEEGTIISTSDGRFNYTVTEPAEMNGDLADRYFNTATNRYEIPAIAAAVAVGNDYDLPPQTINVIQTFQEDFDGVINKDYARQGTDPLDKYQFRDVIWSAMQGVGQDVTGAMLAIMSAVNPTGFDDFAMVPSTDFTNYARLGNTTGKLGYDIYVISDNVSEYIQRGTADGGEQFLYFTRKPVLSVVSVAVDGTEVPFSLDLDQTDTWRGSPQSNDRVQLASPLQPAQTYEVRYLYYDFIYETNLMLQGRQKIFQSDTLVRLADPVSIYIAGEVNVFTTADKDDVIDDIRTFTEGYLRDPQNPATAQRSFVTELNPSDYQRSIEGTVDGVLDFRLTRFVRLDRATLPVEYIVLDGVKEYPTLDLNFSIT